MLDYENTRNCRMEFLASALDDPAAAPCGRCDNCTEPWYSDEVSHDASESASNALGRVGVELEPRGQWPSGMEKLGVQAKGRIPAGQQMSSGRALARMTDLGWGNRVRELLAPGSEDRPLDALAAQACVKVLSEWGWETRPVGVVSMPSRRRPLLIKSLAEGLATVGRIPYLGELQLPHGWPSGSTGGNSAFRLAAVWDRFAVPADGRQWFSSNPGPVLLVDDLADSRWSLTVAAKALREAGVQGVLPFVLALKA